MSPFFSEFSSVSCLLACYFTFLLLWLNSQRWNSWMQRESLWLCLYYRCPADVVVLFWSRTLNLCQRGKRKNIFVQGVGIFFSFMNHWGDVSFIKSYRSTLSGKWRTGLLSSRKPKKLHRAKRFRLCNSSTRL